MQSWKRVTIRIKRLPHATIIVLDDLVLVRSITTLLLAATLILQSVMPCCAISKLLAMRSDVREIGPLQTIQPCSCCPHSRSTRKQLPREDKHPPGGMCPFCGGLLFYNAPDNAAAQVVESQLMVAASGNESDFTGKQASKTQQFLQPQVLGRPFLNVGMRLLI